MESLQVKDYMNHYPMTFSPEMVIEEALLSFLKTKQIGGPVIDKNKKLIGFLSETDVMEKMLESIYHNAHIADVSDLMSKDLLKVKPYDSVLELAQNMLKNRPKIYPVVNDDGVLVGTISRNDVLHAIKRHMDSNFKR